MHEGGHGGDHHKHDSGQGINPQNPANIDVTDSNPSEQLYLHGVGEHGCVAVTIGGCAVSCRFSRFATKPDLEENDP